MIEGLYSVTFGTQMGNVGGGVVVFGDGKAQGGDLIYFYDGTVRSGAGDVIKADIHVKKYGDGESVFGNLSEFQLSLSGEAAGPSFVLEGHLAGDPSARITVQCKKLA